MFVVSFCFPSSLQKVCLIRGNGRNHNLSFTEYHNRRKGFGGKLLNFMDVYLLYAAVFILGIIVGSFLNVVILRLPADDQSIVFPASHCPACNTGLKWYDNIPLLSFIILKRKCRFCGEPISWQYPLVELSMGLFALALFSRFLISDRFLIYFIYCAALLAVILIDFYHQIKNTYFLQLL